MVERAARDPAVDIEKLDRLLLIQERRETGRKQEAYAAAMAAAQAALVPVVKNSKNDNTGKKYADLLAIADQALPVIYSNGFAISVSECESPTKRDGFLGVACEVSHALGHSKRHVFDIPIDNVGLKGNSNKTPIQAYGSTLTYARRYAVCNIFNIAVTDTDGNAQPPQSVDNGLISAAQLAQLEKLMAENGVSAADFCNRYEIGRVADVPARYFDRVIKAVSAARKQGGAGR